MRSRNIRHISAVVVLLVLAFGVGRPSAAGPSAPSGGLDSPGPPESTTSYTLEDIYNRLDTGTAGSQSTFTEPSSGPTAGTGHTLDEIMAKAPAEDNTDGAAPAQVLTGKTYWSLRTDGTWGTQTGLMPNRGQVIYTPGTSNQTVAAGYHDGSGYMEGDADLVADNIRSGTSIFGVAGDSNVVNTSSGDATAGQILSGRKAWVDGGEVTGSMPNRGQVIYTPGTSSQTVAEGYHNGSGYVAGDADLSSGNIRSGTSIFGVAGDSNVVNTGSGDAAEADILSGKIAWVDGGEVTGSMPNRGQVTYTPSTSNQTVAEGYHDGSGYVAGDADLMASNIISGVQIFGVIGTYPLAPVPKTGQTQCYTTTTGSVTSCPAAGYPGQDGEYQKGVAWPNPRFTDNGNGTVTDNLTGLIWLESANCAGTMKWADALSWVNGLYDGCPDCGGSTNDCDLSDGSSAGDGRLPNVRELQSLIDYGRVSPALPSGHPFTSVQTEVYWSSTTHAGNTSRAWHVHLNDGYVHYPDKTNPEYVWPVRGGQ